MILLLLFFLVLLVVLIMCELAFDTLNCMCTGEVRLYSNASSSALSMSKMPQHFLDGAAGSLHRTHLTLQEMLDIYHLFL